MNILKKTGLFAFVVLLAACSGSDTASTAPPAKKADAGEKKDFLFKDMKDSMDATRDMKNLMQKNQEAQKQELDKL